MSCAGALPDSIIMQRSLKHWQLASSQGRFKCPNRVWAYNPKEWLEIEKVRPIGFIGKELALEKKITEPSEIIKQNQGFEISRLLNQQREPEQHPGIDR